MKYLITLLFVFLHSASMANTSLIISTTPGGLFHKYALDLEPFLSSALNSPVIVESRPGGNGAVAAQVLASNKTPKISLLLTYPINDLTIDQTNDIIPVAYLGSATSILVARADAGYSTTRQWLEHARTNNVSFGVVNANNLIGYMDRLIDNYSNNKRVAIAMYRSGSLLLTDVVGGHVDVALSTPSVAMPYIKEGKLIVLGAIGSSRARLLPDIPTLRQQGYTVPGESRFFNHVILWANPGADPSQIQELRSKINQFLLTPDGDALMLKNGLTLEKRRQPDPADTIREITKN